MDFDFSDDQVSLRDAVAKWVDKGFDFSRRHAIRKAYTSAVMGADTGSNMPRLMPWSFTSSIARSMALLWPEMTTCEGSLSFATVQVSPSAAAFAKASAFTLSASICSCNVFLRSI